MSNDLLNKIKNAKAAEAEAPVVEEVAAVGAGNITPEEGLGDMLAQLNASALASSGNVTVGMTSSATGPSLAPSMRLEPTERLPGYYTVLHGAVRLSRTQVIESASIGGRFFYPLDSPAAPLLEKQLGKGVTKVDAPKRG